MTIKSESGGNSTVQVPRPTQIWSDGTVRVVLKHVKLNSEGRECGDEDHGFLGRSVCIEICDGEDATGNKRWVSVSGVTNKAAVALERLGLGIADMLSNRDGLPIPCVVGGSGPCWEQPVVKDRVVGEVLEARAIEHPVRLYSTSRGAVT